VGLLELTGGPRRGSGGRFGNLRRLRIALVVAAVTVGGGALVSAAHAAGSSPSPADLRCIEGCAGKQTAAAHSLVRITGSGLRHVVEVSFRGRPDRVAAEPTASGSHRVLVRVPRRAVTGPPRVVDQNGDRSTMGERLRIISPGKLPERGSFKVLDTDLRPHTAFFDGGRDFKLAYRFRAYAPVNVTVKLVRGAHTVQTWADEDSLAYAKHKLRWNGLLSKHHVAPPGHYRFELKAPGRKPRPAGRVRILSGKFPIRGPHSYGGAAQRFGAPRSGGRVHQGQDVFASCGTRVVAAVGGRVQARGSDPVLYGNWIVVDAKGSSTDYRYAHFEHPASVHQGARVRTGQTVGRIGRTGNARTIGCQLHFEVWPHGWERGSPVDPFPILKRWDGWS
jgi:murein DD-endopeptidase MepM/ murein hydrolase activator NlpD